MPIRAVFILSTFGGTKMSVLPSANPETQPATQATPQAAPSVTPQEQAPQENKPLTEADYRRIAHEEAVRAAQSLVDKAEYRISRKAQEQIRALDLNKNTLGLTDDQVQQAKMKILTEDVTPLPQTPQASESLPEAEPQQPPQLMDHLQNIFKTEGITIEDGDPEVAKIIEAWNDPNGSMPKFYQATYGAIAAKRQRLQRIETTARVSTPGGAGGSVADQTAASAHEYWGVAYKK